jgi:hypothetical protein
MPKKGAAGKTAQKGKRAAKEEDELNDVFEPLPDDEDQDDEFEHSVNNPDEFEYLENIHRRLFLRKAFGINPDGSPIDNAEELSNGYPTPEYNSVKTVETYNRIVSVLENWGDDAFVKANPDHPVAK